jgi:hypothetical protein
VPTAHVRIVLGADYVAPATLLDSIPSPATGDTAVDGAPDQGQPINSGQIPCVD